MNGEKGPPLPLLPLDREIRFAPFFIDGGNLGRNNGVKSTILLSEYSTRTKTQKYLAPRQDRKRKYILPKKYL